VGAGPEAAGGAAAHPRPRVRYRDVLRNREFAAVFASQGLSLLGDQLTRIALALLVFERTRSPFAVSCTFAVSYLAYLVGGPLLSGLADRHPRLTVMVVCDLLRAPAVLLLCIEGMPLWTVFAVVVVVAALAPPFDSARGALQPDLLSGEAYVVGNALLSITGQLAQVLGFVLGGALVAATSVSGALALDASTFLVSAGLLLLAVRQRPAALSREQRESLLRGTADAVRLVLGTPVLRQLLALSVLASAAVIGTEGLAVAVADVLHGGAVEAGLLTAAGPAGFLLGSVLVLRASPDRRQALLPALLLLSCLPLLVSPLLGSTAALLAVWVLAGVGSSLNLVTGPRFMQLLPHAQRGRGYGLAGAMLMVGQGTGLVLAGLLANAVDPRTAVAALAAACLLLGVPLLRAEATRPEGGTTAATLAERTGAQGTGATGR